MTINSTATLAANDVVWQREIAAINTAADTIQADVVDLKARLAALKGGGGSQTGETLTANPNTMQVIGPVTTEKLDASDTGSPSHSIYWTELGTGLANIYLGDVDGTRQNCIRIREGSRKEMVVYAVVAGVEAVLGTINAGDALPPEGTSFKRSYEIDNGAVVAKYNDAIVAKFAKSIVDAKMGGPGKLGNFVGMEVYYASKRGSKSGVIAQGGQTDPLVIDSVGIDADGYTTWDARYISDTPLAPVQRVKRIGDSGDVVLDFSPMQIVSNAQPGRAKLRSLNRVTELGSPFIYEIGLRKLNEVPAVLRNQRFVRAPRPTLGSNVLSIDNPYRGMRSYTNMLCQGYCQDPTNGYKRVNWITDPLVIDFLGNPLKSGIDYMHALPDENGVHTFELTWESGEIKNVRPNAPEKTYYDITAPVRVAGERRITWTARIQRPDGGAPFGRMTVNFDDLSNPPKGLFLCRQGDDKTQRFHPRFVAFLRELKGPMRDMDGSLSNGPIILANIKMDWSKRAIPGRIGDQYMTPFEDYIEMSRVSGRTMWLTMPVNFAFEPGGIDFLQRAAALLRFGTGSYKGMYKSGILGKPKLETGNERWNPNGLGEFATWPYLVNMAKSRGIDTSKDGGALGCALMYIEAIRKTMDAFFTSWDRTEIKPLVGLQMSGNGDIDNFLGRPEYQTIANDVQGAALAPYVPGDPNAGFQPGQQPDGLSPEEIVAWLDKVLDQRAALFLSQIQYLALKYGLSTDVYEWNIARKAIANMSNEQERALKKSQVYLNWATTRLVPVICGIGGDSCVYNDIGGPSEKESWYAFEGDFPGAGNGTWLAMIAYQASLEASASVSIH